MPVTTREIAMSQKRLFVIYAGGTIGMTRTAQGYAPAAGFLPAELAKIAQRQRDFPAYTLKEYAPLIDSSNLQVAHWNRMVADIAAHYADYDGFVVIHGTDTLAYTASALSFMLENLDKPVIVTGAMVALCETPNDAEQNLVDAFHWAAHSDLREVAVAFNRELLRGNRSRKLWGSEIGAFGSPNYPILGRVQGKAELNPALFLAKPNAPFAAHQINADLQIVGLKLYPGYTTRLISRMLAEPLHGVVWRVTERATRRMQTRTSSPPWLLPGSAASPSSTSVSASPARSPWKLTQPAPPWPMPDSFPAGI